MVMTLPQSLVDEVRRHRASLFLGAGASREAGFPGSQELADHLAGADDRLAPKLTGKPLDVVANHLYLQPAYGPAWVRRRIIDKIVSLHKTAAKPPSKAHARMALTHWRTIFTTNYDRLIEATYEQMQDVVQTPLAIYAPDPQILRHEADIVRVIKLNGDCAEAARNSDHRLVLTFQEQQEARKENAIFYELLRTEAVNGPIVFVGFRLTHPGAGIGTSPEFQELRQLLQEMGPAAGWHYCVTLKPDDDDEARLFEETLAGNRIQILYGTFGEFMEALKNQLQSKDATLGSRPPLIVPVGKHELRIPIEEATKDLRQFELLGTSHLTVKPPSVRESLDGMWNWGSFREGHFIDRSRAVEFDRILASNQRGRAELVLASAPPGWGKTIFLRQTAVRSVRSGRPTFWLNPHGSLEIDGGEGRTVVLGSWDAKRIGRLIEAIHEVAAKHGVPPADAAPLLVADNCSERSHEASILFRELARQPHPFTMVLSVRDHDLPVLIENNRTMQQALRFSLPTPDQRAEIEALVAHCLRHGVAPAGSDIHRETIVARIMAEEALTELIFALQVIFDKDHRPFSTLVKEYWTRLPSEAARHAVLRTAALHRFGSASTPRLYSLISSFPAAQQAKILEGYNAALNGSVLFENMDEDEPCVRTLHSLVADRMLKVSGSTPHAIDTELITLIGRMTNSRRDLEVIRGLLRKITDYKMNLSSEEQTRKLFDAAAAATQNDWVVCQQYAKFLTRRTEFELAFDWATRAASSNPHHGPLAHTKGNVLRRWGMTLMNEGQATLAHIKFNEARQHFAASRVRKEPDEYGYVTHLDMIAYLLEQTSDPTEEANLLAEGVGLFKDGTRLVGQDKLNFLLDAKYQKLFDLSGAATKELCQKVETSLKAGRASPIAVAFLADSHFRNGRDDLALAALDTQKKYSDGSPILYVKQAEILAKLGRWGEAVRSVDAARRRRPNAENSEVLWLISYWDLIVSFVAGDFPSARAAAAILQADEGAGQRRLPRGYIWAERSRSMDRNGRSFMADAKRFQGTIRRLQAGGAIGHVEVSASTGETYSIEFNTRSAGRRDLRVGDRMEFAVAIVPRGLRAEALDGKPFTNTVDDVFAS